MRVCACVCVRVCVRVCAYVSAVVKEQSVYIFQLVPPVDHLSNVNNHSSRHVDIGVSNVGLIVNVPFHLYAGTIDGVAALGHCLLSMGLGGGVRERERVQQ